MIVAWPLLVVIAIFFAAWMKPALPNGEWFQVGLNMILYTINLCGVLSFIEHSW